MCRHCPDRAMRRVWCWRESLDARAHRVAEPYRISFHLVRADGEALDPGGDGAAYVAQAMIQASRRSIHGATEAISAAPAALPAAAGRSTRLMIRIARASQSTASRFACASAVDDQAWTGSRGASSVPEGVIRVLPNAL